MTERPFHAVHSPEDGVLTLTGLIDELVVDELREILWAASDGHTRPLTLNLSDVDFLPSLALGAIITAMKESNGQLTIEVQRKCIARRVLEVTGIPHVVTR